MKSEKRSETFQREKGFKIEQLVKFLLGVSEIGLSHDISNRKKPQKKKGFEGFGGLSNELKWMFHSKRSNDTNESILDNDEDIYDDDDIHDDEEYEQSIDQIFSNPQKKDDPFTFCKYGEGGINNSCRFDCFLAIYISVFHDLPCLQDNKPSSNKLIEAMKQFPEEILKKDFVKLKLLIHNVSEESYNLGATGSMELLFLPLRNVLDFSFTILPDKCGCNVQRKSTASISLLEITEQEIENSNNNFTMAVLNKLWDKRTCKCNKLEQFDHIPGVLFASRDPTKDVQIENQVYIDDYKFDLQAIVYLQSVHFFVEIKNPKTDIQLIGWFSHNGLANGGRLVQIEKPLQTYPSRFVSMVFYKRIKF